MNTLHKDRRIIDDLSRALNKLVKDQGLWKTPASYNRGEKLPLTESGRDTVTQLVRFLLEHDIGPLSVMQETSGTTVDVQIFTISSFELNDLLVAIRSWKERYGNRKKRVASLRFRLRISGNEDPLSASRLRSF